MTEQLESNPSNGIPELIKDVKAAITNTDAINRDLLALTVEVETLRETLAETVSAPESDARRMGIIVGGTTAVVGAVQVTDWHVETCRINPIAHRFQPGHRQDKSTEFWCDVTFPTHNHGSLEKIGDGLSPANGLGIIIYGVLGLALIAAYVRTKVRARRYRKNLRSRQQHGNEKTKIIYSDPKTVKVLEIDQETGSEIRTTEARK